MTRDDLVVIRLAVMAPGAAFEAALMAEFEHLPEARGRAREHAAEDRLRLSLGYRPLSLDDPASVYVSGRAVAEARWLVAEADYALSVGADLLVPRVANPGAELPSTEEV